MIKNALGIAVDHIFCLHQQNDSCVVMDLPVLWNSQYRTLKSLHMTSALLCMIQVNL